MQSSKASKPVSVKFAAKTVGRLYFLDLSAGRVVSSNPDGSDLKTIVNEGRKLPDGIVVDVAGGHIYWTNMGNPKANDGTIDRADLDGTNVTKVIPPGTTWTPKQLQLDAKIGDLPCPFIAPVTERFIAGLESAYFFLPGCGVIYEPHLPVPEAILATPEWNERQPRAGVVAKICAHVDRMKPMTATKFKKRYAAAYDFCRRTSISAGNL